MKNKQEFWISMIISAYSKKLEMLFSEAANILLANGCLDYLEEYYETLHLLSNEDIIDELIDMSKEKASK